MNCTINELPGIKSDNINYNQIVVSMGLADVADMDNNNDLFLLLSCLIHGGVKKVVFISKPLQLQKFMKIFNTIDEALHCCRYI